MKTIPLTQGKHAIVDDQDFTDLNQFKWFAFTRPNRCTYACRTINKEHKRELMHRRILGLASGDSRQCDHVNGDGLDNQRANLRIATGNQNQHNRDKERGNTSGFKGVSFHKKTGSWRARIQVNGKVKELGYFHNPTEVADAYDSAAVQFHKDFARTNKQSKQEKIHE